MKLEDLLGIASDEVNIKVYDKEDKSIAKYDGKDSIPAVLCGVKVTEFTIEENTLEVKVDFLDNTGAIDYLKGRLDDINETIATDDYHFDNPESINCYVANQLDNIIVDIREIQANLNRNLDWNCDMYI